MTSPTPKTKPANEAFPFPTREHHDAPPPDTPSPVAENPSEDALDHGVEESFPASDPVSVTVTKVKTPQPEAGGNKDTGTKK